MINKITNKLRRKRSYPETTECIELIRWRNTQKLFDPELLFHISNEGKRAIWMSKLIGIEPGVSDYFLMIPIAPFHGLWIEMKAKGKKPTEDQIIFLDRALKKGYAGVVCDSWGKAVKEIENYLLHVEHKL